MHRIFKPAIVLMNRIKFLQKFSLIFIIFLLPITVFMGILIVQLNKNVEFAVTQRKGLEYSIAVRRLIQHVQQHRGLSAVYLGGQSGLKDDISAKESEIHRDIEAVDNVDRKYGKLLHTTGEWERIKLNWSALGDNLYFLSLDDAFKRHTTLIEDMLLLNTIVFDNSKISLQSKIENYYLVDGITHKLLWVTEYMGRARAIGAGVAAKKELNQNDYYSLLYLTREISKSLKDSERGTNIAFNINEELKYKLQTLNTNAYRVSQELIENINSEILGKGKITLDASTFFVFATETIDEVYKLIDLKSLVLDEQLANQVQALTYQRDIAIVLIITLLIILMYLFTGFYLAIKNSISAIEAAASEIANGNLTQRLSLSTRDETKTIEKSLNKMVDSLVDKFETAEQLLNRKFDRVRNEKELLESIAYHDPLTNLPNRLLFKKELSLAIDKARKNRGQLAILFLDLDRFKLINDTLGHEIGDRLINEIANRLRSAVCPHDLVCRLGGDEFTILLTKPRDIKAILEESQRILKLVQEPWAHEDKEYHITTSIGISIYPRDGQDVDTLIKNADIAMYRAKEEGKNNYKLHTSSQDSISAERFNIETNLRKALENNEFELHYQPKADTNTGQIVGMEALIRWNNPELGSVSPGKFIPIAEDTGLIIPIGEWVLKKACLQNKSWQAQGYTPLPVSVNMSTRQFQQIDLVERIKGILEETGLHPRWLELEITEGITMQNVDFTIIILQRLKKLGISISIDDFGKGFSSLSYIKDFKIDTLKIDSAFVQDINNDKNDKAIVSIIIALAKSLKLNVVAEGVENCLQLKHLINEGCYLVQGYIYSKPLPPQDIDNIFKNGGSLVWNKKQHE